MKNILTSTTSEDSEVSRCLTGMHKNSRLKVFSIYTFFSVIRSPFKMFCIRQLIPYFLCRVIIVLRFLSFIFFFSLAYVYLYDSL